ncbi:DUF2989 domain-containing protein [Aliiglaciecola sp. CAU 1673]|uniref:DUF2989 domain-containing protein n=1 Tax=Aliiglaciecola sp. CAU 1673 TaxID=3032595 RepID=UPI0023DC86F4|nr:DUF2989 domain-containing protein [Aliiglaciecola sp. CAU 1673]MDF2178757.1 DUF2989 domain-containing protein [Aliiglaciecola sp. CAU 1673]
MHRFMGMVVLAALTGCDSFSSVSVKDICEQQPQLCSDLNPDSWCRAEKSRIIKDRYEQLKSPSDLLNYDLLLGFENYKKCISKASDIEHIKLKEKQSERVRGLMTAERELKRLARETQGVDVPHLLYYHWSRFDDQDALKAFLQYEKRGELEYPEMQVALATYYSKFDRPKTISLLYHALELYGEDAEVDPEIFLSLSTINMKEERFEQAYIWGYVGQKFGVEDLNLTSIESILVQQNIQTKALKKTAEHYIEQIEDGRFIAPL